MIGSIVRSMRMMGKKSDMQCETLQIPSIESFQDMSLADMRDLRLGRISWRRISNHYIDMICVELNDGQKQKAGPVQVAKDSFDFSQYDITRVEVQMDFNEENIKRIVFYSGNDEIQTLNASAQAQNYGRWERFEIGPKERLIGCELHHIGEVFFFGITFLKWTLH